MAFGVQPTGSSGDYDHFMVLMKFEYENIKSLECRIDLLCYGVNISEYFRYSPLLVRTLLAVSNFEDV